MALQERGAPQAEEKFELSARAGETTTTSAGIVDDGGNVDLNLEAGTRAWVARRRRAKNRTGGLKSALVAIPVAVPQASPSPRNDPLKSARSKRSSGAPAEQTHRGAQNRPLGLAL